MKERICPIQRRRDYYLKNRDKILEKKKKYYEANKYKICHNTLNHYCFKSIERIKNICPERINDYISRYPFDEYAEQYIKRKLTLCKIYPKQARYADCYDAGMFAYLYSIHRCAFMNYNHTARYIKKMIRIYIICAIVLYDEERNLCKTNNFKEVRLDSEEYAGRY